MKKVILAELAVLALLVIGIVIACFSLPHQPVFAPDSIEDQPEQQSSSSTTGETTVETTTEFVPTWKTYPESRQLLAQQYFVYDCDAGSFLTISGEQTERIYPASVTKLFTAYLALQYLQPETQITAGNALDMVAWGSSVAKIEMGDVLTVQQLVEAMMLPSGNDAAYILAVEAARAMEDSPEMDAVYAVDVFMQEMNKQAAALGMTGTHFVNPDGIHDVSHYTTFADLAILGKLAMENEIVMQYAATPREQVTLHGETLEWKNTNALVDPTTPYYCPYAVGLKTGQTPSAGSCLLSAFRYEGRELIIGVFGCPEEEDRFDDTLQLFNKTVLE